MRLRRFAVADVESLVALHGDPAVMRHIDDPVPRAVVETETLPGILREYDELPEGFGQFVVLDPDFAGWVSLKPAGSVGLDPGDTELGYRILPACQGRGLATAAASSLVRRAFTDLGLDRVVATTMAVNTGSRRVLEKVGLRHVHTFFADWPDALPGAEQGDVVYALTKAEWLTR